MIERLPFAEIWAVDFEFIEPDGGRPIPVCMVAKELRSGRELRLWQDELPPQPPFRTDDGALFVSYMASAELKCMIELGWPVPVRILDLYIEFRVRTSGMSKAQGRGLLDALAFHGLLGISKEEKAAGRALVRKGGPWSDGERRSILDYCATDVYPLGPLLERMLPRIQADRRGLGQALLRGRFMPAVAHMELEGVPIDTATLAAIREHKEEMKVDLVRDVDAKYGVYEGTAFRLSKFEEMIRRHQIAWPLTPTGRPSLEEQTFRVMCDVHPWLHELRELRDFLGKLKLESLTIGRDGRNRAPLMPFKTKTGRNAPSNAKFVFGPSKWIRHLIKPTEGRAVAYLDWSLQEFAIAAVLSNDTAMLEVLDSGDMYLEFAKLAGLAPPDATKATHRHVRDQCKPCVLGLNYGMQAETLSYRLGSSPQHAERTLRAFANRFSAYSTWAEHQVEIGVLRQRMRTVFGWPMRLTEDVRPNTIRNFPMQAHGAEMLRLACMLATERGVQVIAPVHDAIMVEGPTDEIDHVVEAAREAMDEASKLVLNGYVVRTDAEVTRWPDRCSDARGSELWQKINRLLAKGLRQ